MGPLRQVGGWAVWAAMLLAAWTLPGKVWRPGPAPLFPWGALLPFAGLVAVLGCVSLLLAAHGGRGLARSRLLSALEAPPLLLWGILLLALWPATFGPPGLLAWMLAFLAGAVPTELRWMAQALPPERPFPEAWGAEVRARSRRAVLRALAPRWLAARLPVWLTATLVLERLLGVPGLGSDWVARVAARDRVGIALWVLALAGLWATTRRLDRSDP